MSLDITNHARQRAHKRLRREGEIEDLAAAALEHGIAWAQATGPLRRYLLRVMAKSENTRPGVSVLCYQLGCYVFSGQRLITCWRLPPDVRRRLG